jgi:hypothetical protein
MIADDRTRPSGAAAARARVDSEGVVAAPRAAPSTRRAGAATNSSVLGTLPAVARESATADKLVDGTRLELVTSALRTLRSPS